MIERVSKESQLDILKMLEALHEMAVEEPKTLFGPLVWGVNKEEIAMQIAKIRASLPSELKQAMNLTRDTERIVENAREDANMTLERAQKESERIVAESKQEAHRIIEQAKLQQEQMIVESEVVKISKDTAESIITKAELESQAIRRGAETYAYDVLSQIENVGGKVLAAVERGKSELHGASQQNHASLNK